MPAPEALRFRSFIEGTKGHFQGSKTSNFVEKILDKRKYVNSDEVIEGLVNEKRITLTNLTQLENLADLLLEESDKSSVKESIKQYRKASSETSSIPKKDEFIGRSSEVKKILQYVHPHERVEEYGGVCLHGPGGVGKTHLARKIADKWEQMEGTGKTLEAPFKELKTMKQAYPCILRLLIPKKFDYEDARPKIVDCANKLQQPTLFIFDDIEADLMVCSEFQDLIDELCSNKNLRLIMTTTASKEQTNVISSRKVLYFMEIETFGNKEADALVVQDSLSEIKKKDISQLTHLCNNKPLIIKATIGTVKDGTVGVDELNVKIKDEISHASSSSEPEIRPDTTSESERACLAATLDYLPTHLQNALISLAVFPKQFTLDDACLILNCPRAEASFILEELSGYRYLVEYIHPSERFIKSNSLENLECGNFQIHQTLQIFLGSKESDAKFSEIFAQAKTSFLFHFVEKLQKIARLMNTDFIESYNRFEIDRPNFELCLDLTLKHEFLLFSPEYSDTAVIAALLKQMIQDHQQLEKLYHSWSMKADEEGKILWSCDLMCLEATQVVKKLDFQGTLSLLQKVESRLQVFPNQKEKHFHLSVALYQYSLAKTYMACSNHVDNDAKLSLLRTAVRLLEDSLLCRRGFLGEHTDTTRIQTYLGDVHYRLGDMEQSLHWFEEAFDTRKRLSSGSHNDLPLFIQNISTVYETLKDYQMALKYYQYALDMEKELKIDGYKQTASINRNLSYCYFYVGDLENAKLCGDVALEIRRKIFGPQHQLIVESLYQCGLLRSKSSDHKELKDALSYFEEANEMENSLKEHSRDWMKIRKGIRYLCGQLMNNPVNIVKYTAKFAQYEYKWLQKFPSKKEVEKLAFQNIKQYLDLNYFHSVSESVSKERLSNIFLPFHLSNEIYEKSITMPLSDAGITVHVPEKTVEKPTRLKCKVKHNTEIDSSLQNGEVLVSSVIQLETVPPNTQLKKPIDVYISHSGKVSGRVPSEDQIPPDPKEYFEIVVKHHKTYDPTSKGEPLSVWKNVQSENIMKLPAGDRTSPIQDVDFPVAKVTVTDQISGMFAVISRPKYEKFQVDASGKDLELKNVPWPKIHFSFPAGCVSEPCDFIVQEWPVDEFQVSDMFPSVDESKEHFVSPILEVIPCKEVTFHYPVKITCLCHSLSLPWLNLETGQKVSLQTVGCLFTRQSERHASSGIESEVKWEDVSLSADAWVTKESGGLKVEFETLHFSEYMWYLFEKAMDFIFKPVTMLLKNTPHTMIMWSIAETSTTLNQVIAPKHLKDQVAKELGLNERSGSNSQHDVFDGDQIHFNVLLNCKKPVEKIIPWEIKFRNTIDTNLHVQLGEDVDNPSGIVHFTNARDKLLGSVKIVVEKFTKGELPDVLKYLEDPPQGWLKRAPPVLVNGTNRVFLDKKPSKESCNYVRENIHEDKWRDLGIRLRISEEDLDYIEKNEKNNRARVSHVLDEWFKSIQNDVGIKLLMKTLYDLQEHCILRVIIDQHFFINLLAQGS